MPVTKQPSAKIKNSLNKSSGWLISLNVRDTNQIHSISDAIIHYHVKQVNHSYNLSRHWLGFKTKTTKLNGYTPDTKNDNGLKTYILCN